MITALAPLGAKYNLQFVPEFGPDNTVSVAVIYSLKSDKDAVPKTLTFSGPVADVEQSLVTDLPKAVEKLTAHATSLEELDSQLKKERETKEAEVKKKADEEKAKADAAATAKAKGKTKGKEAPKPAAKSKPAEKATNIVDATELKPAWKTKPSEATPAPAPAPAPVQEPATVGTPVAEVGPEPAPADGIEELGSLFPEQPSTT